MFLKRGIVPVALVLLLLLGGCAQLQSVVATEPTASPTATLPAAIAQPVTSRNGSAVASGEVLPAQKAQLGFSTAGRVDSVSVAVGDSVAAGDVLIVLDQAAAEASVAMAYGLLRAQANAKDLARFAPAGDCGGSGLPRRRQCPLHPPPKRRQ
ncbi:MAG: biotin/lipoyl-binding protein [Caldilineaceae bacterium]